jgi:hypothetical protein
MCHRSKQNKRANDSDKTLAAHLAVVAFKYFHYFFHRPCPLYFFFGGLFLLCTPLFFLFGLGCQLTAAVVFAITLSR